MSPAEAERWLLDRELFGMRFGLERMRRLLTALGSPQRAFRAIHVVGTNGKSSTTRYAAAALGAGAYLSPHLVSFAERIRVGDEDLPAGAFAAAVGRVAAAAELVERAAPDGDERVTQFEALTAAAFTAFATHGVGEAVVEAGLGGRLDATNVLAAEVVVLTNVDLEHTRFLGETVRAIAREKLAVVARDATLVVGEDLRPDALAEARATPARELVVVPGAGAFPARNRALALAAAEALRGEQVPAPAVGTRVPGRLEVVARDPLTVLDAAHNPAGVRALLEALPEAPLVAVVAVLEDKDARGMLEALGPRCHAVVLTETTSERAVPASALAALAPGAHVEPDPHAALALARALAEPGETVVATGSITLVADLVRPAGAPVARSAR